MNDIVRCVVTGAGGYVGSRIVDYLRGQAMTVYEMRHTLPAHYSHASYVIPFSLDASVESRVLSGFDVLVHCAHDLTLTRWEEIEQVNIRGSLRLFDAARHAGIKRIIFISSLSAFNGCRTMYGRSKLAVESEASKEGGIIVRPGMVYDETPGGLFGSISRFIQFSPIVPLISGDAPIYVCHSGDLAALIYELSIMGEPPAEPIAAASEIPPRFKEIVSYIASRYGRKPLVIPISSHVVYLALQALERAGWRGRLNSERVLGLLNLAPSVDFAPTRRLKTRFRDFAVSQ